ncbi:hypothetical protein ABT56_07510 [Photobacterium aquae]|uniref:Uncharacterized protein n=1 Tax=Photobacterium aquae TaxID=1195763 RepID=A0A0J1H5K6_9GAMM|nr:hypothetical protein [Photobacterium aquae]KLV06986.1 hypothetical protein ABT56_07510 [Photobacterium aquae]
MSMPIEDIEVVCEKCGTIYQDWMRGSVNLDLDDFDEEYIDKCSSSVCPKCQHKVYHSALVVKNGVWKIKDC